MSLSFTSPVTVTTHLRYRHDVCSHRLKMRLSPVKVLNGRGGRTTSPQSTPVSPSELSASLKSRIQYLYADHVKASGVDYKSMRSSESFSAYVSLTEQLSKLNLHGTLRTDADKIAFYVNLYNALTQHAVTVLGPPPGNSTFRVLFAMGVGYEVGGYRLSLNDIENGILRKNRGVSVLRPPFGEGDDRKRLCVKNVDERVHFVLNCAATSCPPVLYLAPEDVEQVLTTATKGFLQDETNFRMKKKQMSVGVSKIFKWYMQDFGGTEHKVLEWIARNGDGERDEIKLLKEMLESNGSITIEWLPYDWSLNSV